MHTVHLILVEADDASEINDDFIPEADWYDWFSIGGRWDGLFDGKNIISLADPQAKEALDGVIARQNREFIDLSCMVSGMHMSLADVPESMFGFEITDQRGYVQRTNTARMEFAQAFDHAIGAATLADAHAAGSSVLLGYRLRRLAELIDYDWCSDSGFYDSINYTANPASAIDALGSKDLFLVAVDFHF